MNKLIYEHIGGQAVHVGDCQIWAGIFYLDSSTDYREYLPQKSNTRSINDGEELIMLDELNSPWNIKRFVYDRPLQLLKVLFHYL